MTDYEITKLRQDLAAAEAARDSYAGQLIQCRDDSAKLRREVEAATKQVTLIEDFLWGRNYCTELYISPLGFSGGEAWQVELNYGDSTEVFQGASVGEALAFAMVAAMQRKTAKPTA